MIKIVNTNTMGWGAAIRGMRNPMNSWGKSDSYYDLLLGKGCFIIGDADYELMIKLAKKGPVHAKYRRMIAVSADITAPLYLWKEYDTYKVGTVANSCSTMHKIADKEFTIDDFSHEHLISDHLILNTEDAWGINTVKIALDGDCLLRMTVDMLNFYRCRFLETKDKKYWWQLIQLLPSSYNQKRTVMLNYEVLSNIYKHRKDHKLDEWKDFCKWIRSLPYSDIITCEERGDSHD